MLDECSLTCNPKMLCAMRKAIKEERRAGESAREKRGEHVNLLVVVTIFGNSKAVCECENIFAA